MSVEKRRDGSLWSQTFALLWKNLLLKWRRKWHTVLEWLQHLAFVLLLFFFTLSLEDTRKQDPSAAADLGRLDKFNMSDFVVGYNLKSSAAHKIMQKVHKSGRMPGITIEGITNETELLHLVTERDKVAVTFENEFTYYIQYPSRDVPRANDYLVYRRTCYDVNHCPPTLYMRNGFLTLQAAIDAAIIEAATNHSVWASMASMEAVKMASTIVLSRSILHLGFFILIMCMCYTSLSYLLTIYIAKERK